jgi:DNA-binding HxlR family transcriptional regulator
VTVSAPTVPPRVEYELTALGRDLLVPVKALGDWAIANCERVDAACQRFDALNSVNVGAAAGRPRLAR